MVERNNPLGFKNGLPIISEFGDNPRDAIVMVLDGKEVYNKEDFLKKAYAEIEENENWIKQFNRNIQNASDKGAYFLVNSNKEYIKDLESRNNLLRKCIKEVETNSYYDRKKGWLKKEQGRTKNDFDLKKGCSQKDRDYNEWFSL